MSRLGDPSPLPMLGRPLETPYVVSGDLPADILSSSRFGHPPNLYPYQLQDDYDRIRTERDVLTVVLENDRLRAQVLPEWGGRLWRLWDKESGKNLLYTPSSVQFANLALRDAWFAGGIEWNIGTRGHSPTTCEPLHAAIVSTPQGIDVLRMWEYERLRGVVFRLDIWLPADSAALLVGVTVHKPGPHEAAMYWWSNAAVPQQSGSRVLAPADTAFASDYLHGISRVDPRADGGIDGTYPVNAPRARDYFFDLPPGSPSWEMNVDADGDGLAMVSTPQLRGRKLFVWGTGPGGRRWQRWLSPDGGQYAEIQAGLAQTQFQHLWLHPGETWSWVEAYGNAGVDPGVAHGADWPAAVAAGADRAAELADPGELTAALEQLRSWDQLPPARMVCTGSGWGAVESARRRHMHEAWVNETATPFGPDTVGPAQQPWLDLLRGNGLNGEPGFVQGDGWAGLLAAAPPSEPVLLHRAVLAHAGGAPYSAALYDQLLALEGVSDTATAHAHRGLALLELAADRSGVALHHYELACRAAPHWRSLLVEAATAAIRGDQPELALRLIEQSAVAADGRLRLLAATAEADAGRPATAAEMLLAGIEVTDLREGDVSVAGLWRRVLPDQPVPDEYDFSMGSPHQAGGADYDSPDDDGK